MTKGTTSIQATTACAAVAPSREIVPTGSAFPMATSSSSESVSFGAPKSRLAHPDEREEEQQLERRSSSS